MVEAVGATGSFVWLGTGWNTIDMAVMLDFSQDQFWAPAIVRLHFEDCITDTCWIGEA